MNVAFCLKPFLRPFIARSRTMPVQRLKIWPGVKVGSVVAVLRGWLAKQRARCLAETFKELLPQSFEFKKARCVCMVKFGELATHLVLLAHNGVLGHACCKQAFEEVMLKRKCHLGTVDRIQKVFCISSMVLLVRAFS